MATSFGRRTLIVLAALAILIVPAVGSGVNAQAAEKVLHYGVWGEPDTVDPQQANYADQVGWAYALFRGLLRYDEKGVPAPSIALEVPSVANGGITEGGKVYTYKLRDWKWSDGKGLVTAQDFVYSWQRLVDPKQASAYGNILNGVVVNAQEIQEGKVPPTDLAVKAVDDKTFQVTLVKPIGYFNQIAALWFGSAVRKDNVERPGLSVPAAWTDPANGEVVGSGPFRITKWEHGSQMVFEKNPNYSGEPAKLDKVMITLQEDPAVNYASYQADELDISNVSLAELDSVRGDPAMSKELHVYTTFCTFFLRMNNTAAPFDNVKVRQAFAHAVDRDTYIKVINKNIGKKTYSFLPPGIMGYDAQAGAEYEFDPALAKKLLAEAGYPDGQGFPKVPYNYVAGANNQRRAEWFQAQLKDVLNIDIELQPMETAAYQRATSDPIQKIPGIGRSGWCSDYVYPSNWLGSVFKSGGDQGNANNLSGYKDPEYDKLSDQTDAELDTTKAETLYKDLQKRLIDAAPVVFIHNDEAFVMVKPRVKDMWLVPLDGGAFGTQSWETIDLQ